ncbi:hypothetical protein NC653_026166 [Populus alba x Populus x berolinensis]|uniref:Uncharacterized protein n=1 Tax=Populus alba x Populus x berolinensis TaxID=444605 RepID=A0AAD6Q9Y2_9ROSI|nr:hypothetical protein NC653_026166 [Populus alba x Populus x berolinensis]
MRVFFLLKILYRGAKEVLSPALTSNPDPPPFFICAYSTCVLMHRVLGLPGIASLFRQDRPARCKSLHVHFRTCNTKIDSRCNGNSLDLVILSWFYITRINHRLMTSIRD